MAPRKGFGLFTRVIADDQGLLPPDKYWYVLTNSICKGSPARYFKKSSVVSTFPEEFCQVERRKLRLANGEVYDGKAASDSEIVASSFGLLVALLRQQPEKSVASDDSIMPRLKMFLNELDLSVIEPVREGNSSRSSNPPAARRRLNMPVEHELKTPSAKSLVEMTPPPSKSKVSMTVVSPNLEEICSNTEIDTPEKALMVEKRGQRVIKDIQEVCDRHRETLSTLLSFMCAFGDEGATSILNEVMENVSERKGVKRTVSDLLGEGTYTKYVESLRVPDWVLVYFKTKSRISDRTWQSVINITNLGRTGNSCDIPVLLNTNQIKAARRLIFDVVKKAVGVTKTPHPLLGWQVNIFSVVELIVRQQRLHQIQKPVLQLLLKIDGRPFWGRDQVLIGIVPRHSAVHSHQSSKSVYPLAIANCKENRENLKVLLIDINEQKRAIKKDGINVDGNHYSVEFIVTLDYNTLKLLLVKKDDSEFKLGGKGVSVEFCFICNAIRGCSCHDVAPDETCVDCLRSKAKIGRQSGMRDDLLFLLDEELSSIQLCALHMEMRNTEQILASIGLLAHKVDALKETNQALKSYGPESFKGDRITIKKNLGQESAIKKNNVHVSSMSGPTEREILHNIQDIVEQALPLEKLKNAYTDLNTAKNLILNRVTFCQTRIDHLEETLSSGQFVRDFGTHTETVDLAGSVLKVDMEQRVVAWQKEQDELSENFKKLCKCRKKTLSKANEDLAVYVAKKQLEFLKMVCQEWKEISLIIRKRVFQEDEQGEIDLFDLKCKEWGFMLLELFGSTLGSGDYVHLLVDHAAMLFRRFLSFTDFTQQGFEASHKDQRGVWLTATNHDQQGEGSSIEQIFAHYYAWIFLFLRFCYREALKSIQGKAKEEQTSFPFYFRGCGWKKKDMTWDDDEIIWIRLMDNLMTMMFGGDFFQYDYDEKKTCFVVDDCRPEFVYEREEWARQYVNMVTSDDTCADMDEDVDLHEPSVSTDPQDIHVDDTESQLKTDLDKPLASTGPQDIHVDDTESQLKTGKVAFPNHDVEDENMSASKGRSVGDKDVQLVEDNPGTDNHANQDSVVAVFPPPPALAKVTVLEMDLETLRDGNELNDSIVDFFMMYSAQYMDQDLIDKSHTLSSFFYTKLSGRVKNGSRLLLPSADGRYARVINFTRNIHIFEKEFLFVPVCRSGHWFLILVHNLPLLTEKGASIFVIDSIAWSSEENFFGSPSPSPRDREAELIRSFLRCEWMAKHGEEEAVPEFSSRTLPLHYPKVPQQENGYDCGVFLLLFFEEFLKRKCPVQELLSGKYLNWYHQASALQMRSRILAILRAI